jgi:hypothetical protein
MAMGRRGRHKQIWYVGARPILDIWSNNNNTTGSVVRIGPNELAFLEPQAFLGKETIVFVSQIVNLRKKTYTVQRKTSWEAPLSRRT